LETHLRLGQVAPGPDANHVALSAYGHGVRPL
jgi:hypothetical protein